MTLAQIHSAIGRLWVKSQLGDRRATALLPGWVRRREVAEGGHASEQLGRALILGLGPVYGSGPARVPSTHGALPAMVVQTRSTRPRGTGCCR